MITVCVFKILQILLIFWPSANQTYKKPPPPAPETHEPKTKLESFKNFRSFEIVDVSVFGTNFVFKFVYSSQISIGKISKNKNLSII